MAEKLRAYPVGSSDSSNKSRELDEIYIGKMKDGSYHLLGYRPVRYKPFFSERECTSLDLGVVSLPDGRRSVDDLVKGDLLVVRNAKRQMQWVFERYVEHLF